MPVTNRIADFHEDMIAWRRDLHAHPEIAFEEKRTSDFVAANLAEFGIEVHRGMGGTGVVGTLRNGDGPAIGLRADMDALPMTEATDIPHKSTIPGRMHACGHDGHTAMLLGAARYLAEPSASGAPYDSFSSPPRRAGAAVARWSRTGCSRNCRSTPSTACTTGRA